MWGRWSHRNWGTLYVASFHFRILQYLSRLFFFTTAIRFADLPDLTDSAKSGAFYLTQPDLTDSAKSDSLTWLTWLFWLTRLDFWPDSTWLDFDWLIWLDFDWLVFISDLTQQLQKLSTWLRLTRLTWLFLSWLTYASFTLYWFNSDLL